MIFFNTDFPEHNIKPMVGFPHLVQCGDFTPSGYAVATWDGEKWVEDTTGMPDITPYVQAYKAISQ